MIANSHTNPVDLDMICADFANNGVVVIETTCPNFKSIASMVQQRMTECVLPLAVKGVDHACYHYLSPSEVVSYSASTTGERVAQAVAKWQAAGSPFPFSTLV